MQAALFTIRVMPRGAPLPNGIAGVINQSDLMESHVACNNAIIAGYNRVMGAPLTTSAAIVGDLGTSDSGI